MQKVEYALIGTYNVCDLCKISEYLEGHINVYQILIRSYLKETNSLIHIDISFTLYPS